MPEQKQADQLGDHQLDASPQFSGVKSPQGDAKPAGAGNTQQHGGPKDPDRDIQRRGVGGPDQVADLERKRPG